MSRETSPVVATPPSAVAAATTATLAAIAALAAAIAGCTGDLGTIQLRVVTAPGSDLRERIGWVRLTLDEPSKVVEGEPGDGLALQVDAAGSNGRVTFEGFANQGDAEPIAVGHSGLLPIAAIDAEVVIFVAPPLSVTAAQSPLPTARRAMGVTPLSFGALFVGGISGDGVRSGDVDLYSVYTHDFLRDGEDSAISPIGVSVIECTPVSGPDCEPDVPQPRTQPIVTTGLFGDIYVLGGVDTSGQPSDDAWRLVPSVPPRGVYLPLSNPDGLTRVGAAVALHGDERFVVTGDPPLEIDGILSLVRILEGAPALVGTATTTLVGNRYVTLFAGAGTADAGAALRVDGRFTDGLAPPPEIARHGHGTVSVPGGVMFVIGGERDDALETTAVRVDVSDASFSVIDGFLATPRRDAAVAVTAEFAVVAGGTDAACDDLDCGDPCPVLADAEVFAVGEGSLTPVAEIDLVVPRRNARAIPLSSGHILIAGGCDDTGAPIAEVELFTPSVAR